MAGVIGDGIKFKDMTSTSMDLNSITTQSTYLVYTSCGNTPNGMPTYGWVTTLPSFNNNYGSQFLLSGDGTFYFRVKNSGTWGAWKKITHTTL